MAIVYSYEQETQPTFGDLLLGTDVSASGKPTKSFSIQSIVDLVQTGVPGGGTVTSIDTTATTFISLIGGNITTTGSLSASLTASGTPSASNYLRGDNVWAAVPGGTNTTYTINSVQAGLNNNIRLNGSDSSQTIVSLLAGPNIALTNNGSNAITIGVSGLPVGTVTSVTTGSGLYIVSGSATVNPVIGVDLTGLNNYIKFSENQTTAISNDFIAFNQSSSTDVKTTTLAALPINALTNVKAYIDAGDTGDIRNDTDTFTSTGAVQQVVSLSGTEYAALVTKNANTLYVVVAAASQYMTTLAFTNNISGTEYTIGGDQVGTTKMGIAGASYAYSTSITPNAGFFFSSGPTVTNATGTFSVDETVYTILAGTVEAIVVPPVTATLSISNTITGGSAGTAYTIGGDLNGATQSGASPLAYAFNTTVTPIAGYEFVTGPTISNASGTLTGDQTVVTSISGQVQVIPPPPCVATLSVDTSGISGGQFTLSGDQTGATQSGNCPLSYSFTTGITADSGYYFSSGPTITNASGSISGSQTVFTYITGTLALQTSNAIVNLTIDESQVVGNTSWYTLTGDLNGAQQIGPVPFNYSFTTTAPANANYAWTAGPYITNASGQKQVGGTYNETTSILGTIAAYTPPVDATLQVNYNIAGAQVYTPTGDQTGATQSGASPFTYSFSSGASIPNGYVWTSGPTVSPNPNTGTITANTTVTTNVSGTIAVAPPPSCNINVGYTFSIFTICNAAETTPITMYHVGVCDICGATSIDASFVSSMNINDVVQVKYQGVYMPFQKQSAGSVAVSVGSCLVCPVPPVQYTVTLAFSNNVTGFANTTTSLTPSATITGDAGDAYQFVHTITANSGYAFTSGPTWTDSASNNGTGTINGTIPSSNITITQSVSGVVQPALTSFLTNASPETSTASACAAGHGATRYHTGSGTYPTDGDTLYQTNNFGAPMGAGYWGLVNGTYVVTNSSSVVIESGLCI